MARNLESMIRAGVKPKEYLKKIEKTPKATDWRTAMDAYNPDAKIVEGLTKIKEKATIACFSAYWCKDCVKHVPALAKTLQKAGNTNLSLVMLEYDENKKLAEEADVKAIPTIIVFGSRGTENERIIEHPSGTFKSVEEEILSMLAPRK